MFSHDELIPVFYSKSNPVHRSPLLRNLGEIKIGNLNPKEERTCQTIERFSHDELVPVS